MDRYWSLSGKLFSGDQPILRINEGHEIDYLSDETKDYMRDRDYACRIYSNASDDDLLNMQYHALIKAKDQNNMLLILAQNTRQVQVLLDFQLPYNQKSPKEDPNDIC